MVTQVHDSLACFNPKEIGDYGTVDDIVNFPERKGMLKLVAQATKDEQNTLAGSPANLKARCEKFKFTNDLLQAEVSRLKAALQARMHLKAPDPMQSIDVQLLKERLAKTEQLLIEEQEKTKALEQKLKQARDEAQKTIDTLETKCDKEALRAEDMKKALSEKAAQVAKVTAEIISVKDSLEQTKVQAAEREKLLQESLAKAKEDEEQLQEASSKKIKRLKERIALLEKKDVDRDLELKQLRMDKDEFDLRIMKVGAELRKLSDENERLTSVVELVRTAVTSKDSTS